MHNKKRFIELEFMVFFLGALIGLLVFFFKDLVYAATAWLITALVGSFYPLLRMMGLKQVYNSVRTGRAYGGKDSYEVYSITDDAFNTKLINSDSTEISTRKLFYNINFVKAKIFNDTAYLYTSKDNALIINRDNMTVGNFDELLAFLKTKFNANLYIDKRKTTKR